MTGDSYSIQPSNLDFRSGENDRDQAPVISQKTHWPSCSVSLSIENFTGSKQNASYNCRSPLLQSQCHLSRGHSGTPYSAHASTAPEIQSTIRVDAFDWVLERQKVKLALGSTSEMQPAAMQWSTVQRDWHPPPSLLIHPSHNYLPRSIAKYYHPNRRVDASFLTIIS